MNSESSCSVSTSPDQENISLWQHLVNWGVSPEAADSFLWLLQTQKLPWWVANGSLVKGVLGQAPLPLIRSQQQREILINLLLRIDPRTGIAKWEPLDLLDVEGSSEERHKAAKVLSKSLRRLKDQGLVLLKSCSNTAHQRTTEVQLTQKGLKLAIDLSYEALYEPASAPWLTDD